MPRYKYMCDRCGGTWNEDLPISSDPHEKITCNFMRCNGRGVRRIIGSNSFKVKKETFGDWYKKETGKDLLS